MVLRERKLSEYLFYWLNIADKLYTRRIAMAELRIHDQSSTFYKSLRSRGTDVNVDLNLPDRSGIILTEKELMDILNRESKLNADAIMKPDITETPIDANGFAGPIPIATYKTSETFLGEHDRTEWIASDTSDFHRITDGSSNKIFKTSWYPNLTTSGEQVYVKYRFRSGNIVSPWSDTLAFRGTAQGIITPSITVEENGLEPAIKITPLAYYGTFPGIEHVSTSWVIEDEEGNKVVERPLDTVNKVKLVIEADVLDPKKEYTIYATQHTNVAQPAWAKSKTAIGEYVTPKSKIDRPVLRYDDSGDPKVIGSAFSGEGAHLATEWMIYNDLGAKIAEFSYDTIKLTTFPMKDFVSQGRKYRITARYITAESKSPRGSVSIEIPAPSTGDISTVSGMNINPTTENRGMSISVVPFVSPVREDIQYWRYQVRLDISHGSPVTNVHYIHSETDTSQEVEDSWNKALRKDLTPAESWLAWFPNSDIVNPTISISGTSVRMGLKTEIRNRAQVQSKTFDYVLGNATWEDINTLNPLIKISDSTGADVAWMGYRGTEWTLSKKTGTTPEGNPIWTKVRVENSTDKSKHRLNALETDTEYRVTVVHKTNCFCFAKDYEFRSAAYIMASPVVAMEGSGKKWKIKSSGYSLTNYTGPNGQHGSTSYLVTKKNTGEKVWESLKDTVNKTVANIPESVLELGQQYNVRVIFHSAAGHDSGATTVSFKVPTYRAKFDKIKALGLIDRDGEEKILLGNWSFEVEGFKVVDSETNNSVSDDNLAKVDWTVTAGAVNEQKPQQNDRRVTFSLSSLDYKQEHINLIVTAKAYSVNGLETEVKTQYFQVDNPYIETCDNNFNGIFHNEGNVYGFISPACVYQLVIPVNESNHLSFEDGHIYGMVSRRYVGVEGKLEKTLLLDSSTNKRMPFLPGDFILTSYGYARCLKRTENAPVRPEMGVDRNWDRITTPFKDLRLPTYTELLSKLHLPSSPSISSTTTDQKRDYLFSTQQHSDSDAYPYTHDEEVRRRFQTKYISFDNGGTTKETLTEQYNNLRHDILHLNGGDGSLAHYVKIFSPTTKRFAFITTAPMNTLTWPELMSSHPEFNELDVYTARFGSRLYYVRIPTKEEWELLMNNGVDNRNASNTYYDWNNQSMFRIDQPKIYLQDIKKTDTQVKTIKCGFTGSSRAWFPDIKIENKNIDNGTFNVHFVLTPIKESEAPYNHQNLSKKSIYVQTKHIDFLKKMLSTNTIDEEKIKKYPILNVGNVFDNVADSRFSYDAMLDVGYIGRIHYSLFKSYKDLLAGYGLTSTLRNKIADGDGATAADVQWYDIFYYHGTIGLIPNGQPWYHEYSELKSAGVLFGTDMGSHSKYVGDMLISGADNNYYKVRISGLLLGNYSYASYSAETSRDYEINNNRPNIHAQIGDFISTNHRYRIGSFDMLSELLLKLSDHTDNDGKLGYNNQVKNTADNEAIHDLASSFTTGIFFTKNKLTTNGNSSDLKLFDTNYIIGKSLFTKQATLSGHGTQQALSTVPITYGSNKFGIGYNLHYHYAGSGTYHGGGFRPWLRIMPTENRNITIFSFMWDAEFPSNGTTFDIRGNGLTNITFSKLSNYDISRSKVVIGYEARTNANKNLFKDDEWLNNWVVNKPSVTPIGDSGSNKEISFAADTNNEGSYIVKPTYPNAVLSENLENIRGAILFKLFNKVTNTINEYLAYTPIISKNDLNKNGSTYIYKAKYKVYVDLDSKQVIYQEREKVE